MPIGLALIDLTKLVNIMTFTCICMKIARLEVDTYQGHIRFALIDRNYQQSINEASRQDV